MDALQNHIQSYGGASEALTAYKNMKDKDFMDDWLNKQADIQKKVETLGKIGEQTFTGIEGAKAIRKGGQYLARKLRGGGDETTEDDSGAGASTDPDTSVSNNNSRTGGDDDGNADAEGFGEDRGGGFIEDDAMGTEGGTAEPPGSLSDRAVTGSLESDPSAPDATSGGSEATGGASGPEGGTPDVGGSGGGSAGDLAPELAPDLEEGGAGIGDAVLGGLGTAMDFLGPIGILAGLGVSLYEAFHHTPKPPPPPQNIGGSNRIKSAMVLPTYDSVQDTPASSSAF